MAGDWIKMRTNLWDDPRVLQLCELLDCDENRVVGSLYRLWSIADDHSEDGGLNGLSARMLDRKCALDGFTSALLQVDWLEETDDGLRIPRFDEHNGKSAKRRALDASRKGKSRKRPQSVRMASGQNADTVRTDCGTRRDEKREDEKKEEKKPPTPLRGRFVAPSVDEVAAYCRERGNDVDAEAFVSHYESNGWKVGRNAMKDWKAAVRTWERRRLEESRAGPSAKPKKDRLDALREFDRRTEEMNHAQG